MTDTKQEYSSKKCCSDDSQLANPFIFISRVLDDIIRVMKYHVSNIQTSIKERALSKTYRFVLVLGRSHQKNCPRHRMKFHRLVCDSFGIVKLRYWPFSALFRPSSYAASVAIYSKYEFNV
ncbi:MAG: hypothetical protein WBZ36_16690 [Candidatus Nitrosopolaris sp.]